MSDLTPRQWHSVAKKMRSHRSYRGEMDQIRKEAKLRRKEREKRGKKEEKTRNRRNRWHEKRRNQLNLTQLTQMTGTRWGHKEGGEDCVLALVKLIQLVRTQIPELALMSQSYIVTSQYLVLITCRRWNQADFLCIWPCFCVFLFVPERHQSRNLGLGSVLSLPNTESSQGTVAEFC